MRSVGIELAFQKNKLVEDPSTESLKTRLDKSYENIPEGTSVHWPRDMDWLGMLSLHRLQGQKGQL